MVQLAKKFYVQITVRTMGCVTEAHATASKVLPAKCARLRSVQTPALDTGVAKLQRFLPRRLRRRSTRLEALWGAAATTAFSGPTAASLFVKTIVRVLKGSLMGGAI